MPAIQQRPMVATDFEDISLFGYEEAKEWQRRMVEAGEPLNIPSSVILPQRGDSHSSVQSVSSTSTVASDTSSLRSALSSTSSPALVSTPKFVKEAKTPTSMKSMHFDNVEVRNVETPVHGLGMTRTPSSGRRRSVPTLLDNTSMASLTMKVTNGPRSRKQREMEFEADQDDDSWSGDGLMFNVPMTPALYAKHKQTPKQTPEHKPKQHSVSNLSLHSQHSHTRSHSHSQHTPETHAMPQHSQHSQHPQHANPVTPLHRNLSRAVSPANSVKTPSPLQQSHRSSGYAHRNSLPSIHENRGSTSQARPETASTPSPKILAQRRFENSRFDSRPSSLNSLPALLSRRGSYADSSMSSIEGLDMDASDITLELCKLEERQESRRASKAASDITAVSIASLALSGGGEGGALPSPVMRNSEDSQPFDGDSRRSSLTRPENLPSKSPEEEKKHLKEYEKLLKEAVAAEKRKQQKQEEALKLRTEQKKSDALIWANWLTKGQQQKLSPDLKWRGMPERSRGAIWFAKLSGGALNTTNLLPCDHSHTAQIARDSETIWEECAIFGHGRPLHESLIYLVERFLGNRPDIVYCKSLTSLSALLLLYLDTPQALTVLFSLLKPGSLPACILGHNERLTSANYVAFQKLFEAKFERLSDHLARNDVSYSDLLNPWLGSVFTNAMPSPELAARLMDVYVFDGDAFLLRAALGLLRLNEAWLYASKPEILQQMLRPRVASEDELMKTIRQVTTK